MKQTCHFAQSGPVPQDLSILETFSGCFWVKTKYLFCQSKCIKIIIKMTLFFVPWLQED